MEYSIRCPCGMSIPVAATQAGSEVSCECGMRVLVPPLSRLRMGAGQAAYEVGLPGKIRRMIATEELPWGDFCAYSGRPTKDAIDFLIECERSYSGSPGRGISSFPILTSIVNILGSVMFNIHIEEVLEVHGREVVLQVPLRVSSEWHEKVRRIKSRRRLREMLRTVPVYAELLDEYPDAKIGVVS